MQEYHLDGEQMTSKEAAHLHIKQALALPDYYGSNLDALWDCLSSDFTEKIIYIRNLPAMLDQLGDYGDALMELFWEAAAANGAIQIVIEDEPA
jgi:ribonuclease inhibitor